MGFKLTYKHIESNYLVKPYVNQVRDCSNVENVTRWSKVAIDRNGRLQITPPKKQPFSIELTTNRGAKILLAWLKKYLNLAKHEIQKNNFMPNLTGGLNTRILTWFWRDLYNGPDYFLKSMKPDGKNNITGGQAEIEISGQVLSRLGKSLARVEKYERLTFSGKFTDFCREKIYSLDDPNFIYDYVSFHFCKNNLYFNYSYVCPFVDNLYFQLRHPEKHYMHTLLTLLLCPDLLDIPLYSLKSEQSYKFNEKFMNLVPRVENFIQQYNLRNRVVKLKAKILSFL